MLNQLTKNFSELTKSKNTPNQKILLTLIVLVIFRFGNTIPIGGIDQEALKKTFLQGDSRNAIMQIINMYSGGGGATLLSPFSLGIIPFINASILIDLLTALFPSLEKLQSEEGELGKRKLLFYKKTLTLIFSIVQSAFLVLYLKPYFYNPNFITLGITGLLLVTGAITIVWLTNIIDNKGVGNGTSIIIFTNIIVTLISKNLLSSNSFDLVFLAQIVFLLFLITLISISQSSRINIEVVSARQLAFLENIEKNNINQKFSKTLQLREAGLAIRLNQAGIFPIIIASNVLPFLSFFSGGSINFNNSNGINLMSVFYYILIIGFNYFYTIVFWDPEKIAEQLRKASVSIVNVTPGRETVSYLENVVRSSSVAGGIFLCIILFLYDFAKQFINGPLLAQLNVSSLIILVGVAYDLQRTMRSLYKNILDTTS
jgi:preprotein translocase subunit SecY